MIALVAVTAAGHRAARGLAAAWPDETRLLTAAHTEPTEPTEPGVAAALRQAYQAGEAIVAFLAVGATVRVLAPVLGDKATDPPVVCVDEAGRHTVAVLGGHHGANSLARRVADALGATPVITTASEAAGIPALDELAQVMGWQVEPGSKLARVGAALLSGEPVDLVTDPPGHTWPLPALPDTVRPTAPGAARTPALVVTDLADPSAVVPAVVSALGAPGPAVVYRPASLVVGVGASSGVTAGEVDAAVEAALAEAGLSPRAVRELASVDAKATEAGILAAARARGWPTAFHPAAALAGVPTPHPSEAVRAAVGTPSVAEAAARYAGPGRPLGELVAAKRKTARVTVAVARHRARGRLALVSVGPGARDLLAPRACAELRRAAVVVGLDQYLDQVRDLLRPGTRVLASGLGAEADRARQAVEAARAGQAVAVVGSGDVGVYAMASPTLALLAESDPDTVDVVAVPGITAGLAAASLLGAPLGHDHAVISLSDLHTPWPVIEKRLAAAAAADLVVCLYNPRSAARDKTFRRALAVVGDHRPPTTPVGVVRDATRAAESVRLTTLADLAADRLPEAVDMRTLVIVGATTTAVLAGRMVTPRGYSWET